MRSTLGTVRSAVAKATNLCATDTRVADYVNASIRRLLPKGMWVGTVRRYRICANNSCLTWPRQIGTIEAAAVCNSPIKIRNEWYEFLEAGPGVQSGVTDCLSQMVDRQGQYCSYDDITANSTTSYIKLYTDVVESAGKYVILGGHDENGNWIRTQVSGSWIDGERVAIPTSPASPVVTSKKFSSLDWVIKDATNGVLRLYEFDGVVSVKSLAIYEPDETLPSYRRSYIPSLNETSSGECTKRSVVVMAKLAYYKVANDNDFLLIGNEDALVEMCRALRHYEKNNQAEGMAAEALAISYLQQELGNEQGSGAVVQMRVDAEVFGAGMVENVCG